MYTTAHGRQIGLKLFLEGIEVDVVHADVQSGLNLPATAQIAIPAPPKPFEFHPRTLVHLFFWEGSPSFIPDVSTADGAELTTAPKDQQGLGPEFADSWRLLFCGEATAYSFVKSGDQRHLVLQCEDFTSYWQQIKLYWGTNTLTANTANSAIAAGGILLSRSGKNPVGNNQLVDLMAGRSSTVPSVPGVLGGVVALLEAATGVYDKNAKKNFHGVSDWAAQAELRLHLTRMIAASPLDDTSETFVRYGDLKQYFNRLASQVRSTSSFLELAQTFLQKIYHVHASVVAPPFMRAGSAIELEQQVPAAARFKGQPQLDLIRKKNLATMKAIGTRLQDASTNETTIASPTGVGGEHDGAKVNAKAQPDNTTHQKWAEGDIVRDGLADAPNQTDENVSGKDGKLAMLSRASTDLQKSTAYGQTAAADSIHEALGSAMKLVRVLNDINTPKDGGQSSTTATAPGQADGQTYPRHDSTNLWTALKLAQRVDAALNRALQTPMRTIKTQGRRSANLNCTLLMPDLFTVPPPQCNVLFPTQYMSVRYSRNWMSEPTRLIMHGLTPAGAEGRTVYFSPNRTTGLLSGSKDSDTQQAVLHGTSFLMPHELMTGVLTSFENLGDMSVFRKINQKLNQADAAAAKKAGKPAPPQMYTLNEFMQRAANYLFISKRFEGRTMQVECRFSPQLVAGLPLLLLDPQDAPNPNATEADSTHYVGQVASIQHQFTATGGASTSVTLVKCRRVDEGVRGLFTDDTNSFTHVSRAAYTKTSKPVALDGRLTPSTVQSDGVDDRLRKIAKTQGWGAVQGTTPIRAGQNTAPSGPQNVGEYDGKAVTFQKGGRSVTVEVYKTPGQPANDLPPPLSQQTNQTSKKQETAFDYEAVVTETGVHKTTATVDLSFEAAFTPPWFATIYQLHTIGTQFYLPTLGCQSVVDVPALQSTLESVAVPAPLSGKPVTADDTVTFVSTDGVANIVPAGILIDPAQNTEAAAAALSTVYRLMKRHSADLERYVDQYCKRAYATLPDIMGNTNGTALHTRPSGLLLYLEESNNVPIGLGGFASTEGFHENAYGDLTELHTTTGIAGATLQEVPLATLDQVAKGVKNPPTRMVDPRVDTRAEKYRRVQQYRDMMSRIKTSTQ